MSVYHVHAQCLERIEERVRSPGTRIAGSCELPLGCWEANLGSLESVFLTAKPSLQPCFCHDFRLYHVPGSLECRIYWNWVTISTLNFVIDNCQNSSPVRCK